MKKILILLSVIFIFGAGRAFAYSDIDSESELGKAVSALTERGVLNGYSDGTFRPDNDITRAEMCKMINILFNFTDVGRNDFNDVKSTDWFYRQVLIAKEYKYIAGFPDGTFRGNDKVTREQAAVIINRITPLIKIDDTVTITDDVSLWAREAVQMIANHKLLLTDENGKFRADENLKRSELTMLLFRFIPTAKSDANEETYQGTDAEIAIENAVILANLKAAVRDIESVEFDGEEKELIRHVLVGLNGTIDAGLTGNLINKNYVVVHFWNNIDTARNMYKAMNAEEKSNFHGNLVKLNNSTLVFLQEYFLGDKAPV